MSRFLKVIVNIFLVAAILIAAAILVPPLLGVKTTIIDLESIETNLPMGSVTYSRDIYSAELQSGDKFLKESGNQIYAYIYESGDASEGTVMARNANDPSAEIGEITIRSLVSKIVLTVPFIGYVIVAMHSLEGIIIVGLVILLMIILFILSELWKPDDDDEEEPVMRAAPASEDESLQKRMDRESLHDLNQEAATGAFVSEILKKNAEESGPLPDISEEAGALPARTESGNTREFVSGSEAAPGATKEIPAVTQAERAEEEAATAVEEALHEDILEEAVVTGGAVALSAETVPEQAPVVIEEVKEESVPEEAPAEADPEPVSGEENLPYAETENAAEPEIVIADPELVIREAEQKEQAMAAEQMTEGEDGILREELLTAADDPEAFIPVERPSIEALLKEAEEAGEKARVIRDTASGVTLIDYSELI